MRYTIQIKKEILEKKRKKKKQKERKEKIYIKDIYILGQYEKLSLIW